MCPACPAAALSVPGLTLQGARTEPRTHYRHGCDRARRAGPCASSQFPSFRVAALYGLLAAAGIAAPALLLLSPFRVCGPGS